MKAKKGFIVEIIADKVPEITHHLAAGYGIGASAVQLFARPLEIIVARDGEPVLCIQISDNGNVNLINCGGMFTHLFGPTVNLKNTRPWTTP